jgi:hypothetical protein
VGGGQLIDNIPQEKNFRRFPPCESFNFLSRTPTPKSFPAAVIPYDAQPIPKVMSEACLVSGLCTHCFNKGITASTNIVKPVSQNSSGIRAYLAAMAHIRKGSGPSLQNCNGHHPLPGPSARRNSGLYPTFKSKLNINPFQTKNTVSNPQTTQYARKPPLHLYLQSHSCAISLIPQLL